MPNPTPRHVVAITATLADCRWHDLEDVIATAVTAIPPGVAYRNGDRMYRDARMRRGAPAGVRRDRREQTIATGAREIVRTAIWTRLKSGEWQQRDTNDGRQLRLGRCVVQVGEVPPWMVDAGDGTYRLADETQEVPA